MHHWEELYIRYLNKESSPEEVRLLLEHFRLDGNDEILKAHIEAQLMAVDYPTTDNDEVKNALNRVHHKLMAEIDKDKNSVELPISSPIKIKLMWCIRIAAAILLVSLIGGISFYHLYKPLPGIASGVATQDIAPGGNKAIITLADGSRINLDNTKDGAVVAQQGFTITKDKNGTITYKIKGRTQNPLLYNTMSTPNGGSYQLILADGTKVWLNASSSLRYPTTFSGKERRVELNGEAYFEVAANEKQPFIVKSGVQEVRVLGTAFNITAYADESTIKTALVKGSIKVAQLTTQQSNILVPGQQTIVNDHAFAVQKADIASIIGWKNGVFKFKETTLQTVMNQLSRWYDVDIEYRGNIPETYFYGEISRRKNLSSVLNILKESGLKFEIVKNQERYKLLVLP